MARPGVVRADTLDLQDHENPHAAEHHQNAQVNGLAPHQAAQVQHVKEERTSEEQTLQEAWNINNGLSDEPHDMTHTNGAGDKSSSDDDGEGGESEGEGDDDMMDRISSSPSIDDGGYTLHSSPPARVQIWPARYSSMSPRSPTPPQPRQAFNQSASPSPESSPFLRSPEFPPLNVTRSHSPPAWQSDRELSRESIDRTAPESEEAIVTSQHHRGGRYTLGLDRTPGLEFREQDGYLVSTFDENDEINPGTDEHFPVARPGRSLPRSPRHSAYRHTPSTESSLRRTFVSVGRGTHRPTDSQRFPRTGSSSDISHSRTEGSSTAIAEYLDLPSPNGSAGSWESTSASESLSDVEEPHTGDKDGLKCFFDDDDDDSDEDAFLNLDERFIDSGWGGECLRDIEDIDFEFVYALHTFVATVEGQANATKGDTMVLLDDSNSYWWLVRVVKDSSIGYLPAEHIETPTERLARLNKHRNIDLSATQLSDNTDKPRNPLKKAMRRRNAKTVQFAAPTYVEASDYDYSDDDEADMIDPYATSMQAGSTVQKPEQDEPVAETKETAAEGRSSTSSNRASFDREQAATAAAALAGVGVNDDEPQLSPKLIDKTEAAPLKSRKGTPRNTDSFLKDDTLETRKITLTPGILREDSNSSSIRSPTEASRNTSLESLSKATSPPEETKKETEKKKKEAKKGGMLSGLFKSKKKDKKSKESISDVGEMEKPSVEIARDSPRQSPAPSGKSSPVDRTNSQAAQNAARNQLHKASSQRQQQSNGVVATRQSSEAFVAELEGSSVAQEMATGHEDTISDVQRQAVQEKTSPLSPITNILKSSSDKEAKPKKVKRAKKRVELDDFDSPADNTNPNPFKDGDEDDEEQSDSLVEVSPHTFMHGTENIHIPEPGAADDDDEEEEEEEEEEDEDEDEDEDENEDEEPESLTSSPSMIEHPSSSEEHAEEDDATTPKAAQVFATQSGAPIPSRGLSSSSTTSSHLSPPAAPQTWNDHSLRAWLEDGTEVRDMLVMIHDKSGVTPVSPEHPLMSGLFVEQRKGVQDMMGQLDGLLGSYLQRKGVSY